VFKRVVFLGNQAGVRGRKLNEEKRNKGNALAGQRGYQSPNAGEDWGVKAYNHNWIGMGGGRKIKSADPEISRGEESTEKGWVEIIVFGHGSRSRHQAKVEWGE